MLTRQLTSSPSSLSALTSSNKRSFFPTRDILMDVSFFFNMFLLSFPQKVDTIIRLLQPLERAKRKWNHLELSGTIWNAAGSGTRISANGTTWNYLERRRLWNARSAIGTALSAYPYSKMCELCELCEQLTNMLVSFPKKVDRLM